MSAAELFSIRGKVAVVTGGSRGIGLMIARGFVEAGARVYISARKAEACNAAAAELAKSGECFSVPADLATEAGAVHLAKEVAAREKAVHILVNNAGATWVAPLEEFPDSAFDKLWDVNVKGVFHLTVKLLPLLRAAATKADPARVINISSVDGLRPAMFETYAYSASKAAVLMLTRQVAGRLAREDITVNAIAPGLFPSKMTEFMFATAGEEGASEHIPLRRAGRPDDMAGTCIFLASRAGAYLTGAVIPVDGGVSNVTAAVTFPGSS